MEPTPIRRSFAAAGRVVPSPRPLAWAVAALIALGGSACNREGTPTPAAPAAAAPATPTPAATPTTTPPAATALTVKGEVGSLRLRLIDALPPLPKATADSGEASGDCAQAPVSAEARAADAAGWTVFAERDWAGYRAVGVARAGTHLAGMGCVFPDGQVLLFRDGRPVAQVVDSQAGKEDSDAGLQSLEDGAPAPSAEASQVVRRDGADAELRLGDWNGSQLARLVVGADGGLELAALPAIDSYCAQRAKLPRLEAMALPAARERLLAQGWQGRQSDPDADEGADGMRDALRRLGFPEIEGCSGTGMGYCNYHYRNAAGDALQLTSAGEYVPPGVDQAEASWPRVAGYRVLCAAPKAD
ncbi:hypothetical protein AZ78_2207 [Lysobacter capsici AZ78]|uniref:Uncharacterized protein n=1 Tax=Lysobacter capsici AZ78 TaxID=1444315 RepID=A0A120AGJ0_9GAMM|nr:hypothetical protein [Lysobacter capsici]KWS04657.1 hypothetical protein AZ78_2207 [Lysobacter capsici AZ78]